MLRGQGIPTRIATGFLAKDYDAERDAYVVTSSEGHAWIEVHFEELGWVTFDPTPGEQRANALAATLAGDAAPGLRTWVGGLAARVSEWAESGGDVERMRAVVGELADGPRVVWATLRARLGAWGAAAVAGAAALVLALLVLRRFGRGPGVAARAAPPAAGASRARATTLRARLLAALGRLGFPRAPAQTLRELVASAASLEPQALTAAGALLDRARFGGVPLDRSEEARIESLCASIERRAEPG
jgi:hypothetical protein